MLRTVTLDPGTALTLVVGGAAAGAAIWGAVTNAWKNRRDRTVEFLQLQLTTAQTEIHKLQGQVELLERAGFASIHADHQLILQELRGRKE